MMKCSALIAVPCGVTIICSAEVKHFVLTLDVDNKIPPEALQPPKAVWSSIMSSSTKCAECGEPMEGQFVRALGTVFHLRCFRCMDCAAVVASKFFPVEGQDGRQHPLCELDYFRRLNLICANCDMALRGSYITACDKKYHVEHFTCSLCPTLFAANDSWYEHEGGVYCHFHFSTRFATKCAGCNSAILKQFVEINRNMRDECWHPECYMINKFWNFNLESKRPTSLLSTEGEASEPAYVEEESRETPKSLRENQIRTEQQVYRIWTVLSAFEESSAACISGMLEQVSNGQYLDAILLADKFILHVEALFATIDDLESHLARLHLKGMSHVREARMLCRKTVDLFTLLSRTQETGARRMGMTQELLAIVTGLAHYLKILIRIALTGARKLEKEHNVGEAMTSFLDKLHLLAVQGANPSARRMIKGQHGKTLPNGGNPGTQGVTYGFQSLAPENAGDPPFREGSSKRLSSDPPSDLCVKCNLTVEEDCVRLGTYQRWHSHCVQCAHCGEVAGVPLPPPKELHANGKEIDGPGAKGQPLKLSTVRRPPANVGIFMYDPESIQERLSFGEVPAVILCTNHAHAGCRGGFQPVERLEQYAFLLNIALRRLYLLLKKRGIIPRPPALVSSGYNSSSKENPDRYRTTAAVHLDRKLSATARIPKRSTIVESPSGKSTLPSDAPPSHRHLDQTGIQHAQDTNQAPPYRQPSQDGTHPPEYSTLFPNDPASQAPSQVLPTASARNNTKVIVVDDSDNSSPAPESFIPPVGPGNYRRLPTTPGTARPVHAPPLEGLGGYQDDGDSVRDPPAPSPFIHPVGPRSYRRPPTMPGGARAVHASPLEGLGGHPDDGPGPTPIGGPSTLAEDHSPIPAHVEGMTLADIPRLLEAAQAQEQQRSSVSEEGKAAGGFKETLRQERREEKELEAGLGLPDLEIFALYNGLEQVELREDEDEVYHQQKVKEANREEAARKEQEGQHHEQEGRDWQLVGEDRENHGGQFEEATQGDAERSQTQQEPTRRFSTYKLSSILHMNWASRTRAWGSSRSSFNFSRTSLVSYSTVSEQGDDSDGMMDWERRQEEIYQRQRDQFRQEQERFESC